MKPTPQAITVPPLDRRADVGAIDADKRTVDVTFSTKAGGDVLRYDWDTGKRYWERLSLDAEHVRLDRLNHGAPLLNAHSAYEVGNVIGVVEDDSVKLLKGEARATVRFSKRADVEPYYQDVRDKIIRNVSVGYRVHRFEEQAVPKDGFPIRLAVDWEPYEISMVPMGADVGARVRSVKDVETNPCVIVRRAEEEVMAEETKPIETKPEPKPAAAPPPDAEAIRGAERERITGIQTIVRVAKLDPKVAEDLVVRGLTLDAARVEVFAKMAAADATKPPTDQQVRVELGEDARNKFLRGVTSWLLAKAGTDVKDAGDPGEFRGMTLVDVARECLRRLNISTRGLDKMRIVSEAFVRRDITQSTSDFATLLENTMHKVLQAAYATQPDTWSKFCARGTVSDFRAHNRYRMGSFGALDALNENGEFKNKAISDAEKASITATTKGNIINVSRQMIVNDDMGAFARLLTMLGRAAGLSVEVDVYALLALNSNLGPTMGSAPLFDAAAHANLTTGAALSAVALDLDRQGMASQTDPWGHQYLDLRPAVLLVPITLGGTARVINAAQYDPDTANKLQRPNMAQNLFRDIVDSPRITGTRRYLFADPSVAPVLEVAFLEGQASPVLETKDGWNTDGAEMKVRFDYGVAAVDFRGALTNAGA
jgi:hypothetical protein